MADTWQNRHMCSPRVIAAENDHQLPEIGVSECIVHRYAAKIDTGIALCYILHVYYMSDLE